MFSHFRPCRFGAVWDPCLAHDRVQIETLYALQMKGVKGEVYLITGSEIPQEEQRYSSTLSLTSMLDRGGLSTPRPSHFTPFYQLYRRLGGFQGWYGLLRKISPPLELTSGMKEIRVPATSEKRYILQHHHPWAGNKHPWLCKQYHYYRAVTNRSVVL
jgi:hypothetical protein